MVCFFFCSSIINSSQQVQVKRTKAKSELPCSLYIVQAALCYVGEHKPHTKPHLFVWPFVGKKKSSLASDVNIQPLGNVYHLRGWHFTSLINSLKNCYPPGPSPKYKHSFMKSMATSLRRVPNTTQNMGIWEYNVLEYQRCVSNGFWIVRFPKGDSHSGMFSPWTMQMYSWPRGTFWGPLGPHIGHGCKPGWLSTHKQPFLTPEGSRQQPPASAPRACVPEDLGLVHSVK